MEAVKETVEEKRSKNRNSIKGWELFSLMDALTEFISAANEQGEKIPVKMSYNIHRNMNKLIPIAQKIEKKRFDILKEAGVKFDKLKEGEAPVVPDDKKEWADGQFKEIMEKDYKVELRTMRPDDFEGLSLDLSKTPSVGFLFDILICE